MECRWHFAVYIALTESRSENHSITHFSSFSMITLLQRDTKYTHHYCHDHTLTAWCPHHTLLQRVDGSFQSGWGIGWRCLWPKSPCNLSVIRDKHWIAAVRVVGKQSASLVCFWDSYIYILHIYNIYQRKSNSKVFHGHNCIGLETCIYI